MQESKIRLRMHLKQPLITPIELRQQFPLNLYVAQNIQNARMSVSRIIQGLDHRLLVVVGPCSIHDSHAALEYASLLKKTAQHYIHDLLIVMRVYFAKPRTTVGWKGLISDPFLNESFDMNTGLKLARKLLLEINEMGLPTATEFLDTITPYYLSDLITWTAIGARTAESQIHRELASGLPMPVGFKNNTEGKIKIAMDAVNVACHPHHFIGISPEGQPCIMSTTGNLDCHIVLRGADAHSNYSPHHIERTVSVLKQMQLNTNLMIDCSHGNSGKEHQRQIAVAQSIAHQISQELDHQPICGVMLESNLVEGKQQLSLNQTLRYGQSITDGCLSWEDTLPVLETLAKARRFAIANKSELLPLSS